MEIRVSDAASSWFQREMSVGKGDGVRFFGRVYGSTPVHDGFSMGLERDRVSAQPYAQTDKDGVIYFVNEADKWFFDGYNLVIDYDEKLDEPAYTYEPIDS